MTFRAGLAGVAALLLLVAAGLGWERVPVGTTVAARPAPGLDGAELFRTKGCAACHNGPDTEATFQGPPDLSDARAWAGRRRPGLGAPAYLRQSIREPGAFRSPAFQYGGGPLVDMPRLAVSAAEVDALVRYLLAR